MVCFFSPSTVFRELHFYEGLHGRGSAESEAKSLGTQVCRKVSDGGSYSGRNAGVAQETNLNIWFRPPRFRN